MASGEAESRFAAVRAAIFPGSHATWIAGLVVLVVGAVLVLRVATAALPAIIATNSVDVGAVVTAVTPGKDLCVADVDLPAQARGIEMWLGPRGVQASRVRVVAFADGTRIGTSFRRANGAWHRFELTTPLSRDRVAKICVVTPRGVVDVGGASVQGVAGRPRSTLGDSPLSGVDASVRVYGSRDTTTLASQWATAVRRAALFKGLPGGTAALWIVMLLFPAVAYGVVRVAATADQRSARRLAGQACLVAIYASWSWALMMPIFAGPDEPEHFGYVQHLAESGKRADAAKTASLPYSSEQLRLMGALHHNSTILNGSSRPRWEDRWPAIFDAGDERENRRNGGGFSESASGHSPLYYAIAGLPYRVLRPALDLPELVVVTRLWTALIGALVAGIAVFAAALLLPRAQALWWMAGTLVALQPVFAQVSGTVNNDTLVNLLAASVVLGLLRLWRHGPSAPSAVLLGVGLVLLPLAKVTGFSVVAAGGVGLLVVAVTHRSLASWRVLLLAPVSAIVCLGAWMVVGQVFGGDATLVNVHPTEPAAVAGPVVTRLTQLDYALQTVVPGVQLTGRLWAEGKWPLYDIYIQRGWASYGWFTVGLTPGLVQLIGWALLAGWLLSLSAAMRNWRSWRRWLPGAGILVATIGAVFLLVAVAYAGAGIRSVPGEQGRYIFPAIVPLAVLLAAGGSVLRRRWRGAYAGLVCAGMVSVYAVAWASAVRGWFI